MGTDRRPIALEVDGQYFVGPDNGLFSRILDTAERDEIPWRGVVLTNPDYWRMRAVSPTFQGRESSRPPPRTSSTGRISRISATRWTPHPPQPSRVEGTDRVVRGEIIYVDSFGNCVSNIPAHVLPPPGTPGVTISCGALSALPFVPTYGMVGEGQPLALIGSHGYLEVAVRRGNAAADDGLDSGTPVAVSGLAG